MERQIKLIWDFRGPAASKTAAHHEIHLKEFIEKENAAVLTTGIRDLNDMHSITYIVVHEWDMVTLRDTLKPHRGELYEGN